MIDIKSFNLYFLIQGWVSERVVTAKLKCTECSMEAAERRAEPLARAASSGLHGGPSGHGLGRRSMGGNQVKFARKMVQIAPGSCCNSAVRCASMGGGVPCRCGSRVFMGPRDHADAAERSSRGSHASFHVIFVAASGRELVPICTPMLRSFTCPPWPRAGPERPTDVESRVRWMP